MNGYVSQCRCVCMCVCVDTSRLLAKETRRNLPEVCMKPLIETNAYANYISNGFRNEKKWIVAKDGSNPANTDFVIDRLKFVFKPMITAIKVTRGVHTNKDHQICSKNKSSNSARLAKKTKQNLRLSNLCVRVNLFKFSFIEIPKEIMNELAFDLPIWSQFGSDELFMLISSDHCLVSPPTTLKTPKQPLDWMMTLKVKTAVENNTKQDYESGVNINLGLTVCALVTWLNRSVTMTTTMTFFFSVVKHSFLFFIFLGLSSSSIAHLVFHLLFYFFFP